ncbi:MAG TPA: hypothetical protein VMF89_36025 [Polyangiales bacterium]|nr:hypothetical protein [Polyangiales bacterium]
MSDSIRGGFRCSVVALALLTFTPAAALLAQPAAFDTASAPSEQLRYNAESPKVLGVASGDMLASAWQVFEAGRPVQVKLALFQRSAESLSKVWERQLPLPRLAGLTSDGTNYYVLSAASEDLRNDLTTVSYRPNILALTKLDGQGNVVWERDLNSAEYLRDADGGEAPSAIYSPLTAGTGALAFGAGKLIVALASNTLPDLPIMTRHQRAQYFVVSQDGAGFKAASETSWRHSFDQRLLFDGQDFVFMDLGDASWYMPGAGIALRKIKPTDSGADFVGDLQGVYVYVRQGDTTGSQNFSFTSLGDLENGDRGYVALLTSETSNPGVQRNGWEQPVNEPRNLGFVHVTKGFDAVTEGEWNSPEKRLGNTIIRNNLPVSINVTSSVVDSSGPSNHFTRADKPELSFTQTGIVWLTSLAAGVSAERPKLLRLAADRYLAIWEEWTYNGTTLSYQSTKSLVVDEQGQVVRAAAPVDARLNPSGADRAFLLNGAAAWITSAADGQLTLNVLDANQALTKTQLSQRAPEPSAPAGDTLQPGERLQPDQSIRSSNGNFRLVYQTDGNLVLYRADGTPLWASATNGRPVGHAIMQTDGNLAIYGPNQEFVWNTGTQAPSARLVLQNDGNLVIYGADGAALWASNTVQP